MSETDRTVQRASQSPPKSNTAPSEKLSRGLCSIARRRDALPMVDDHDGARRKPCLHRDDCEKLATHMVLGGELRHHSDTQASDHRALCSVGMHEHGRSRRRQSTAMPPRCQPTARIWTLPREVPRPRIRNERRITDNERDFSRTRRSHRLLRPSGDEQRTDRVEQARCAGFSSGGGLGPRTVHAVEMDTLLSEGQTGARMTLVL